MTRTIELLVPPRCAARRVPAAVAAVLALALAACGPRQPAPAAAAAPLVRVATPVPVAGATLGASGTVRARVEAPLAFQVGGRIAERRADAGQAVRAGQPLLMLDPRDLDQAQQAADAEHAAALAALATAEAELARARQLAAQGFVSPQAVERAELQRRELQTRREAAAARLAQARHARGYAVLNAPAAGLLVDVRGEPGQVVTAGQAVATLAHGAREVEVFLPDGVPPPPRGQATGPDGRTRPLVLREVAGALDPQGRTRRARYTVGADADMLALGSVVATRFELSQPSPAAVYGLPIGALDERGQGARVWRVRDGRVETVPVQVLVVDDTQARVAGALGPQDRVVTLGTHLLQPGMAVRETSR